MGWKDNLKRLGQKAQEGVDAARAKMTGGKKANPPPSTDEPTDILEVIPADQGEKTALVPSPGKASTQEAGVLAQAAAVYKGGHPAFLRMAVGIVQLGAAGIRFVPQAGSEADMLIAYGTLADIQEPQAGEFTEEMRKICQAKKWGARALGMGAGIVGGVISDSAGSRDTVAGWLAEEAAARAVSEVGKGVAAGVEKDAQLGHLPKNRICAIMVCEGVEHKVYFDFLGSTKEQVEELARSFWVCTASVRSRFLKRQERLALASQPAANVASTPIEMLKQLKELLDQGVLTSDEFEQQKALILSRMHGAVPTVPGPPTKAPSAAPALTSPRSDSRDRAIIIACPKCHTKLQAKGPGLVRCPKCQTTLRVNG